MNLLKSVIADDDKIFQKLLENQLTNYPIFSTNFNVESIATLRELLMQEKIDVIFLDIELPDGRGYEFLNTDFSNYIIIAVSGKKEYALEAFNFEVCDFLHKPYTPERFTQCVEKIKKHPLFKQNFDSIFFKVNGKFLKISLNEIKYCESMSDYVIIHTNQGKHVILQTLSNLNNLLPDNFTRCHRSYIVNKDKIEAISDRMIEIGDAKIPVSKSNYSSLKKSLNIKD